MLQRAVFIVYLLLCSAQIFGQEHVMEGFLVDKNTKKALNHIHVLLKSSDHKLLTFKETKADGAFSLATVKDVDGAYLEINHLGYHKKIIPWTEVGLKKTIELEQKVVLLEDVEVKSRPQIRQIGDTLAYNVASFAKEEDRSIGEVLKRMPGIEVGDNGSIKYQGKAISKFYIDGDDLLDDRYAIGTKTIPHKMVKDIEVLTNHEHMKVLKNRRYTDEVAINLVIKDDAKLKLTGQAKLGAGLPKQYDGELNTILFNKKYKVLNVLQGNNIGNDLTGDFTGFNQATVLSRMGYSAVNNLLALGTVGGPPVAKSNYFMNNSVALNANNLLNIKNGFQLKSNIQLLQDKNNTNFKGETSYFSEDSDYIFDENQYTQTTEWLAALRLSLNKNIEKRYINNAFSFEYEKEDRAANIGSNGETILGSLHHQIKGFSNQLEWVPALKNGDIVQVNWYLNYATKPQTLSFSPGLFPDVFSGGVPYEQTWQHVEVPTVFTKASVGYRLPKGKLKQYYNLGAMVEDQKLRSNIAIHKAGNIADVALDSTQNKLHWNRSSVSANAEYEWSNRRWATRLVLPVSWQYTCYADPYFNLDKNQHDIVFNPTFSARLRVSQEDELSFSYQRSHSFGNIENVYQGLLIRNYRTFSSNNGVITENKNNEFGLNYKVGRTIKLLFMNVGLNYKQSISNTILSNVVNDQSTQTQLIEQENIVNSYQASVGFDKYIFALSSTMKLAASWSLSDYNQFFNNEILPFQNIGYTLRPNLELKIWKQLNLSYTGQLSWMSSKQKGKVQGLDRNTFQSSHQLGLPMTLFSGFHVRFSARNVYAHQPGFNDFNYLFFDTFIRYRHKKSKTDFELNLTNLANVKKFETYSVSANMQMHNSYELRGRMAVLKAVFNFK
ncbi:hypothetical protein [Sphingobacterium sp. UBA6320]|uniref:hypothetical protein n=1 Tax=Sphingobacterium sp. UBA6320 TaxID=1947510 RepID=UPI0025EF1252|nr:hypothetical protein [Sphingobacterium sp. UBA6320]